MWRRVLALVIPLRNESRGFESPSSTIFQNDLERAKQFLRGTLGLSSLPDSFRYLVIHPNDMPLLPIMNAAGCRDAGALA